MRTPALLLAVTAAALAAPAAAQAHVEIIPAGAPAGAETRLDVRVPNERDNASTERIDLQLPDGFAAASFEPVPGWDVKVTKAKLAKPVQTDDGAITEGVKQITWTAKSKRDGIPPGAFQDFGLSVLVPGKAGDTLTFKALQTYSNGEVVRWIGAEGSDTPAPALAVTAPGGGDHGGAPASPPAAAPAATPAPTKDDSSNGLAIAALIVGALGLLAGAAALFTRRARTAA